MAKAKLTVAGAGLTVFALCLPALADNGGEDWVTPPAELHESLRKSAQAVVMFQLSSGAPTQFWTYLDGHDGWTPLQTISQEMFVPVSRMWWWHPEGEGVHPLSGGKYALLAKEGEYGEIMYDSKTGATGWFRLADFSPHIIEFKAIPRGHYMVSLSSGGAGEVRAYPFPEEGEVHGLLLGPVVVRPDEQVGDFVRLKAERWNDATQRQESSSLGWIRLHDASGKLLYWPWYYDDC